MATVDDLRAGKLAGARRLNLSAGLSEFPREIFGLADTLEILDLSGNQLSSLPDDLPRLHRLRVLFCSNNPFTELPEVLGRCPQLSMVGFKSCQIEQVSGASLPQALRWLILTDNRVSELPPEIGQCRQLQKLMLAGNRLRALPEAMAACTQLELLRIAANQFHSLPDWLFALPRLSWLAMGGNPLGAEEEARVLRDAAVPTVDWSLLKIGEQLGEGASGLIYRVEAAESGQAMALKRFKHSLTSDGTPQSEMAACLLAGQHPHLIPLLGRLHDHPDGAEGLLLGLIDPDFTNLAGPPSLESCTRDQYSAAGRFSLPVLLQIVRSMASTVAHLHARGLMHGDFYAHNILHCAAGRALLGDFGAASIFPASLAPHHPAMQRLEARAFACLLEELLDRCADTPSGHPAGDALRHLQARCADPVVDRRPLFAEIAASLAAI